MLPLYEIYFGKKFEEKQIEVVNHSNKSSIVMLIISIVLLLGSGAFFVTNRILEKNNEDSMNVYQNEVRVTYVFDKLLDFLSLIYKSYGEYNELPKPLSAH